MKVDRRQFLIASAFAGAGLYLSRDWSLPVAPSDRVRIGVIAPRALSTYRAANFSAIPGTQVVALSEPLQNRTRRAWTSLGAVAGSTVSANSDRPAFYADWRNLLDRSDVDALFLFAPEQVQPEIAIAACASGKDLLLGRPGKSLHSLDSVSKAATANKRLAAHSYSTQYIGFSDAQSQVPCSFGQDLKTARAQHYVSRAYEHTGAFDAKFQRRAFLSNPVEEFDYARGVLGVSSPTSVSCVAMRQPGTNAITRAGLRFEFGSDKYSKAIELDIAGYAGEPVASGSDSWEQPFSNSSIVFAGIGSGFAVQSISNPAFTLAAWSNFVDCVRSRQQAELFAPVSELRDSLKLLQLAEGPCESGRTLVVNSFEKADSRHSAKASG